MVNALIERLKKHGYSEKDFKIIRNHTIINAQFELYDNLRFAVMMDDLNECYSWICYDRNTGSVYYSPVAKEWNIHCRSGNCSSFEEMLNKLDKWLENEI